MKHTDSLTEQSPLHWLVALFMLSTLFISGYAVVRRNPQDIVARGGGPPENDETVQNPTIRDIAINPDAYMGNGYILKGKIDNVYNASAFIMSDTEIVKTYPNSPNTTLLVIIHNPAPVNVGLPDTTTFQKDTAIRVTGRLTRFSDFLKQTDNVIGFDPASLNIPQTTPVLIASSISKTIQEDNGRE